MSADDYRLSVDDVISVRVLYHPDFSVESATVRPDGHINVPVAGDIEVAGRTIPEVAAIITQALRVELRDPQVSVQLVRRHVEPIYVLGAVRAPGAVEVSGPVAVAEAIALAGGMSETATPHHALLIGRDGRQTRIDVMSALRGDAPEAVTLVYPGDTIVVSTQFLVSVMGAVRSPGRYSAEEGDRVADLLAAAGGLTEDAAAEGVLVGPDGTRRPLDLVAITETGSAGNNPLVEPGDLIVIPELTRRITTIGAVNTPGCYDFDEGAQVSDAIALAHGVSEEARLDAALLVRQDGSTETINLKALLQGDLSHNPLLHNGDTLIVPRKLDRIAVLGRVVRPGILPLEPDMTVMDAVAAAGGWAQDGSRPTEVILWRQIEGEPQVVFVDAQALIRGDASVANPTLVAGDIVFVPSSGEITRDEVTRLLLGVSGLLRLIF